MRASRRTPRMLSRQCWRRTLSQSMLRTRKRRRCDHSVAQAECLGNASQKRDKKVSLLRRGNLLQLVSDSGRDDCASGPCRIDWAECNPQMVFRPGSVWNLLRGCDGDIGIYSRDAGCGSGGHGPSVATARIAWKSKTNTAHFIKNENPSNTYSCLPFWAVGWILPVRTCWIASTTFAR